MPRNPFPTADDLTLKASVLLLHAEAARIAEARRVAREAKGAAPATTSAKIEARIRIEKRRNERRERQADARARKEQWETAPTSALRRHSPQHQATAGRWQERYNAAEFERQFGYPPPGAEDEPEPPPAPGDDGIPF